jgi:hypothetical protein
LGDKEKLEVEEHLWSGHRLGRYEGDAGGRVGLGCLCCGGDGWSCAAWAVVVKGDNWVRSPVWLFLAVGIKGGASADFRSSCRDKNREK